MMFIGNLLDTKKKEMESKSAVYQICSAFTVFVQAPLQKVFHGASNFVDNEKNGIIFRLNICVFVFHN